MWPQVVQANGSISVPIPTAAPLPPEQQLTDAGTYTILVAYSSQAIQVSSSAAPSMSYLCPLSLCPLGLCPLYVACMSGPFMSPLWAIIESEAATADMPSTQLRLWTITHKQKASPVPPLA